MINSYNYSTTVTLTVLVYWVM